MLETRGIYSASDTSAGGDFYGLYRPGGDAGPFEDVSTFGDSTNLVPCASTAGGSSGFVYFDTWGDTANADLQPCLVVKMAAASPPSTSAVGWVPPSTTLSHLLRVSGAAGAAPPPPPPPPPPNVGPRPEGCTYGGGTADGYNYVSYDRSAANYFTTSCALVYTSGCGVYYEFDTTKNLWSGCGLGEGYPAKPSLALGKWTPVPSAMASGS